MKRRPPGAGGWTGPVLFLALLLAPAGYRVAERWREPREPREMFDRTAMALGAALVDDSLRRVQAELRATAGWAFDPRTLDERRRFTASIASVIPAGDPSPGRHALWLAFDAPHGLPDGCAVAVENALAGRLTRIPLSERLALAQTTLDPAFRVKFRCGETLGVLHGTGRHDAGGRPLLEARHLTPLGSLAAEEPVLTAGADGIYPPGLLIGWPAAEDADEEGALPLVRAHVAPEDLRDVVVLVDAARLDLARIAEIRRGAFSPRGVGGRLAPPQAIR